MSALARLWNDPGPDRGWSWIVLVCLWIFNAATFGFSTMGGAGVLFTEFLRVFNVSREMAMWPFSTIGIVQCVSAMAAGMLSTSGYLTLRTIFLVSSFLASLSLVLCFWATNIAWIIVIFGILFGIALGLGNTVSAVIICQYFRKYQTTANGIALSGIPVAGFILPAFIDFLIRIYSLRGAMLILGGLTANLLICSLLLRPRTPDYFPSMVPSLNVNNLKTSSNPTQTNTSSKTKTENSYGFNTCRLLEPSNGTKLPIGEPTDKCNGADTNYETRLIACKPLQVTSNGLKQNGDTNKNPKEEEDNQAAKRSFTNVFQMYSSILSQPIFYLVTLHGIVCVNVMGALAMTIIDFSMDKGIPRYLGVILLSIFAISDLIGKLFSGFITDRKWATHAQMSAGGMLIMGLGLMSLCFTNNVIFVFCIVVVIGLSEGSASILINILYREYFGLSKLALSLSLRLLINGVIIFIRPLIVGGFRDKLGSYTYYYYLLGGGAIVTGLLWLGEPILMGALAVKKQNELEKSPVPVPV